MPLKLRYLVRIVCLFVLIVAASILTASAEQDDLGMINGAVMDEVGGVLPWGHYYGAKLVNWSGAKCGEWSKWCLHHAVAGWKL